MHPSEISDYIDAKRERFSHLEKRLSEPDIFAKQAEFREVSKEHQKLSLLFKIYDRWNVAISELGENEGIIKGETDEAMHQMVLSEIENLKAEIADIENRVKIALIPPNPNDNRDIIVEIRPAAGGDEAALFVGEIYRAYHKFSESKGWKCETLDFTPSVLGGIKEVVFSISGNDVYSYMKYEFGVHRVQRVPTTEAGGRIHTSTITIAVLPEAEEVEMEIKPDDLKFDYFRSSGPGGQNVNRTDSAVRVTHLPTGISVASQQEKSQHKNKAIAIRILRARLLEAKQQEEAAKQADSKRKQIGTGDRSERIRTYNFPQNRITDHRFGVSVFNIPAVMNGELEQLFQAIMAADSERIIKDLLSEK